MRQSILSYHTQLHAGCLSLSLSETVYAGRLLLAVMSNWYACRKHSLLLRTLVAALAMLDCGTLQGWMKPRAMSGSLH
jgi:hypothetical protein